MVLRMVVAKWMEPERSHFPWIMMGLAGIAFCIARVVHHANPGPELALYLVRAQYASALMLPVLTVMTVENLGEIPRARNTTWLFSATLPLCAGFVLTPWFISDPAVPRIDLFGQVIYTGTPAPLLWLVAPFALWVLVLLRQRMRAMPTSMTPLRRNFRIGIVLCLLFGINDTLHGAGVIRSIQIFQYSFVIISFVAIGMELKRQAIVREQLRSLLDERGRDLDTKRAAIDTALHKLTRSEARYRHLAHATREGVVVFQGRRVIDVNDAFLRMLDMTEAGLLGADAIDMFDPAATTVIEQLVLGSEVGPTDTRIHKGDGSLLAVSVKATAVPEGAPGTRVLLVRDISGERELRLQLLRADRLAAVGTLAAGTAHEINNPLVYVVGNAEVLQQELDRLAPMVPPGELDLAKEVVGEIAVGGERVRRIVKDLMSLARDRSTDESAVDVRRVLDSTLAMAANQFKHRATLVREFQEVPAVFASEVRLGQVFLNLIVNASQAIPEGRAAENQVCVRTRAEGDSVIVEIADTGVGMDAPTRDRIWDAFFTTKDPGQGTGLGLSISHGIITTLGGSIDVESELGKGSVFRVKLPAMPPKPAAEALLPASSELPATRRILVVDDEELVARNLARMLSPHRVDVAASGREALDRCANDRYDIVLCDLMMPDVTGMELYTQIVGADPTAAARFVFMTGGVFTDKARDFLEHVPTRCLEKPISKADLHRAIADVLTTPRSPADEDLREST